MKKMTELMDEGFVEYVTDLPSKNNAGIEVVVKSVKLFEKYVQPKLLTSMSYQL